MNIRINFGIELKMTTLSVENQMSDYGEIKLHPIISGYDFWCIFSELVKDNSDFLNNLNTIVEAFKDETLFGLCINETDSMFRRGAGNDPIFCKDCTLYLLPIFCIAEGTTAIIIWTHTRARRRGFGKKLVTLLNIDCASHPLPDSLHFWKSCNILSTT